MPWKVADVMSTEVVRVYPDTEFRECVDMLRVHAISALPVVDREDRVVGMVSEADLLLKEEGRTGSAGKLRRGDRRRAAGRLAADVMSTPAVCIAPSATLAEAARTLHAKRLKRLPVVDAAGRLIGIVSRIDLLKPFLRSDESIRMEVVDHVLRRALVIDPAAITVDVRHGVVAMSGKVETKSLAAFAGRMVEEVEGVVGVTNRLSYRMDDSHLRPAPPPLMLHLSADERRVL